MPDSHTVPRLFAAEILNVSVRTLDRYAKKDKISSMRRGRQLYFSEQELLDFKAKQLAQEQLEQVHQRRHSNSSSKSQKPSSSRQSTRQHEHDFVEVEQAQSKEQADGYDDVDGAFAEIRDSMLRRSPEESIYRGLFQKAEGEIKDLRQQLTVSNYKVGRLEAQLAATVPQLEYKRQKQELLELAEENRTHLQEVSALEGQLRLERWAKRVYAVFLFFMMALMPMLVMLRLFA